MNLFDIVDQLFRGTVGLAYNFVASAFAILRNPIRAPWRLVQRHRASGTAQLSAVSFLFLLMLGPALLLVSRSPFGSSGDAEIELIDRVVAAVSEPVALNGRKIWQAALVAVTWVVLIDVPIRLAALPFTRRTSVTRDAMVQAIEFPLGLVALPVAFLVVVATNFLDGTAPDSKRSAWLVLAAFVLIYVSAILPSAMIAEALVFRRRFRFRWRGARFCTVAGAAIVLTGVILVASQSAMILANRLAYQPSSSDLAAARPLQVLGLRCVAHRDRLTADFFLWNPSPVPAFFGQGYLNVAFEGYFVSELGGRAVPVDDDDANEQLPDDRAFVLAPGAIQRLKVRASGDVGGYRQDWGACKVHSLGNILSQELTGVWPAPSEWTAEERGEQSRAPMPAPRLGSNLPLSTLRPTRPPVVKSPR